MQIIYLCLCLWESICILNIYLIIDFQYTFSAHQACRRFGERFIDVIKPNYGIAVNSDSLLSLLTCLYVVNLKTEFFSDKFFHPFEIT